jgi:hypothetical protein
MNGVSRIRASGFVIHWSFWFSSFGFPQQGLSMRGPQTILHPKPRRSRGGRGRATPTTPPVGPLTLTSAIYEGDDSPQFLTMAFDRAIDTSAMVGTAITVRDGGLNERNYKATGPVTRPDAMTVRIQLVEVGPVSGDDIELTATSSNGIVAVGDGAAWAGVTNLVLPFP